MTRLLRIRRGQQKNEDIEMHIGELDQPIFRIDRFVVPAGSEAEFLDAVAATATVIKGLDGCVQKQVLKQDSLSGDSIYITIAEWASFAAFENARQVVAAKHKEMNLHPQELFNRLNIKAELGNFVPVIGEPR
jgi:heme-degrading monooxygenase HmoA